MTPGRGRPAFGMGELSYLLGDFRRRGGRLEAFTMRRRSPVARAGLDVSGRHVFRARGSDRRRRSPMSDRSQRIPGANGRSRRGTAWPARWRRPVSVTRPSTLLDELVKKGSPEWVDRCWLQIGLIQESAGRLRRGSRGIQCDSSGWRRRAS